MSPFDDPVLAAKHQWCYTLGPMGEVLRTRTPDIQLFRDIFNASPSALRSRVEDITKKRKAEEARFRHSAIVESSQDAIASVTLDGVITSWNAGAQRIFGYTESETIGRHVTMLVPPELPDEENKILETLRAGGQIEQFETVRVTKTGEKINVSLSISPIKNTSGEIVGCSGMARDITERKRAEEALRTSEERFRLAAQAGKMYAYEWDVATDVVIRSGDIGAVLGSTSAELLTRQQILARVHPDDKARFAALVTERTPDNPNVQITYRMLGDDGSFVWLEKTAHAFFDASGRIVRMIGMVSAVTERKRAEEALRTSEERLRLAQQAAQIGTFEWNIRTGLNTWTPELESMHGLPHCGFSGKQTAWENLLHPDDRARAIELVNQSLKTGTPMQAEWRIVWPDGSVHWIGGWWQVFADESGEPARMVGVNIDITGRKLIEQRLREYEQAVEASGEMITVIDRRYRVLMANREYLKKRNLTRDQVVGHFAYELVNEKVFKNVFKPKLDECFQGAVVKFELQYTYPKLGERDLAISYFPIEGPDGVDRVACLLLDITDRKRADQALAEMTRKLIDAQEQERSRIGRELHDDINQRLAMVSVELEQLRQSPAELRSRVQELRKELRQISDDVQAISHDLHSSKLELLGVIAGMKSWCREVAERHKIEVAFRSDFPGNLSLAVGLPLFRVLQEAVSNSIRHSGDKRVEVQLRGDSGEIHLIARDSGKGFDVETALRGKGLGLTSMRERVRLVHGVIAIESRPMGGTSIHVRIPLERRSNAE